MSGFKYVLYAPAQPELPWLAVVLDGPKPVDTFGFPDRDNAERVLSEMRLRIEARNGADHP